jgi:hypothetical protein
MAWSQMVDLALDDEDKLDMATPIPMSERPQYPYGTRICLTHSELRKMKLDADCNVGDTIDMRMFGEVTSISKDGDNCRIEIQIQRLATEDENQENTPGD